MRPCELRTVASVLLVCLFAAACAAPQAARVPLVTAEPDTAAPTSTPAKHTIHALVGATAGRDDDGVSLAGAWEYRSTEKVGLGAFAEVVLGSPTTTYLGGAGYFHVMPNLTILAGPGVEFHDGDTHLFGRVGAFYDIPVDQWKIGPAAWLDLGLGDIGATFGIAFGFDF